MMDHEHEITKLLAEKACNPDLVKWHFIMASFESQGRNVTHTAKRLGMHRKSLQRILAKKAPAKRALA